MAVHGPGARYWKFDFHAHTPASEDFGKGPDRAAIREATTPRAWLLAFMRSGVDCVAVTDHNSSAWIDRLKSELETLTVEQPEGYRPLTLFPGVELTTNGGTHLLALFDPSVSAEYVSRLLGAVGASATPGASDGVTKLSLGDVMAEVVASGGIPIPAHVGDAKGLFEVTGVTLKQILERPELIAWEANEDTVFPPGVLQMRHKPTRVTGSDTHHLSGAEGDSFPGSACTWVKMSHPNLDGLRLALVDGEGSVLSGTHPDPNVCSKIILRLLEVKDAKYIGRGPPFKIHFHPQLTAIIGGRGTGKSTLVELLRSTLDRRDELPPSMRDGLKGYYAPTRGRQDEGVLTESTATVLEYEKDGTPFRIKWSGQVATIEKLEDGQWLPDVGVVRDRFKVRMYSQKQVFTLARQPSALLHVVDEATEVAADSWKRDWEEARTQFLGLRLKIREIEAQLGDEPRLVGELADLQRRLQLFEKPENKQALSDYRLRLTQRAKMTDWMTGWRDVSKQLQASIRSLALPQPPFASFPDAADQSIRLSIKSEHERLRTSLGEANALAMNMADSASKFEQELESTAWAAAEKRASASYAALVDNFKAAGAGPEQFQALLARKQEVERILQSFVPKKEQKDRLQEEERLQSQKVEQLRRRITEQRAAFLAKVLEGNLHVRITIRPYGDSDQADDELRRLLQKESGFDQDFGNPGRNGLLGILYPAGGCNETAIADMRQRVLDVRAGRVEAYDARFARHLQMRLSQEQLDELEIWFPPDRLVVEYSPGANGQDFRAIESGSPGQMTAALLAFLLTYSDQPLILDQPEDDLDNVLIHKLIVTRIRQRKATRQIIVVTHNPNVVVNADAELVVALDIRKGNTAITAMGGLQEPDVRRTVCEIMEGGLEAFRQRYRRLDIDTVFRLR